MPHEPWFQILMSDGLNHILAVSIRGQRYTYKLNCHLDTALRELRKRDRNQSQQISWLRQHASLIPERSNAHAS